MKSKELIGKMTLEETASLMSGALTEEQMPAVISIINREKGGFRKLLKTTFTRQYR